MMPNISSPIFEIYIFLMGTIVGSFLNVVIYRTPQTLFALYPEDLDDANDNLEIPESFIKRFFFSLKYIGLDIAWSVAYLFKDFPKEAWAVLKNLSHPPSRCGHCQTPIAFYDNIPVASWFILKGKCRHCKSAYSFRYPMIESLTGAIFVFVLFQTKTTLELWYLLAFASLMWAVFWIDFDHQFIFNVITYPSIFLGIVYNVSKGNLPLSLWGLVTGFLFFESIVFLSLWLLKKEGMGGGDTKLAMALGAWLGPKALFGALVLAFLIGSVVGVTLLAFRKDSKPFPFGPAMVLGGFAAIPIGENLWTWYIRSVMV